MIGLVILVGFIGDGFACPFSSYDPLRPATDTAKKLYDLEIRGNAFLEGLEYADAFDIYNDTLYLIIKDRMVELDMTSGKWSINQPVTDFLRHMVNNGNVASKVLVRNSIYYLSFSKDLFAVSPSGSYSVIDHCNELIYDFNFTGKDRLLIANQDSLKLLSKDRHERKVLLISLVVASGYSWSNQGLCYSSGNGDSLQEFQGTSAGEIQSTEYAPLISRSNVKDLYLSYSTENYLFCFPYERRNAVYLFKKDGDKTSLYKRIALGYDLTPTLQQIRDEEGTPNLRIICKNNQVYVLSVFKGRFRIAGFTL